MKKEHFTECIEGKKEQQNIADNLLEEQVSQRGATNARKKKKTKQKRKLWRAMTVHVLKEHDKEKEFSIK